MFFFLVGSFFEKFFDPDVFKGSLGCAIASSTWCVSFQSIDAENEALMPRVSLQSVGKPLASATT